MDRIDAMKIFVTAVEEGSLAGAARRLRRSPTAISRAIASLEAHVGAELLHRTTRSIRLSDTGQHYAASCHRILSELEEADLLAGGERAAPRGLLTLTAPPISGEEILRPILDDFLDAHPLVSARLLLVDRSVNLIDEGVDIALRVAQLPDSSLLATRVGDGVRRVIVAAPDYLGQHPPIVDPGDIVGHQIISLTHFGLESWAFASAIQSGAQRTIHFTPRLIVNSVRAAVASAVAGGGLTRVYSYHVAQDVKQGRLKVILANSELPVQPVHLLTPAGRSSVPKVRAFIDFAAPRLRAAFLSMALDAQAL
ncbi:LysR family transcriptional regulator [Blastomonas fulva]|uniref:LysR family transcriptional regulator n=1 Tax=Blastomonas fulva TaxID=1550728 RepID=UPI0025A46EFA|nr:LysR family transcriptional regulator [Blastomonas fulva]MDM7930256.1 LysR family transcriptional regulator [Blastomonas fulva]MDM7967803.1 LysR family transcriptional regulator [Blastomonas fulva]